MENTISHIYTSRYWRKPSKIKLLCSEEWVQAEEENKERSHSNFGYKINGVHQWSMGAGYNANCPECLLKLAERKMRTDNIIMEKIIKIARKKYSIQKEDMPSLCSCNTKTPEISFHDDDCAYRKWLEDK